MHEHSTRQATRATGALSGSVLQNERLLEALSSVCCAKKAREAVLGRGSKASAYKRGGEVQFIASL